MKEAAESRTARRMKASRVRRGAKWAGLVVLAARSTAVSSCVRRIMWRVLICLVPGAVLTLASAWAPGLVVGSGQWLVTAGSRVAEPPEIEGRSFIMVVVERSPGADLYEAHATARVEHVARRTDLPPLEEVATGPAGRVVSARLMHRLRSPPRDRSWLIVTEVKGWPVRCCWCEFEIMAPPRAFGGIVLRGPRTVPSTWSRMLPRALPYRPLWTGFVIDVGFWSAASAPFVFAPMAIRRLRRKRRGACAACGYDLSGLAAGGPCPECGGTPQNPRGQTR